MLLGERFPWVGIGSSLIPMCSTHLRPVRGAATGFRGRVGLIVLTQIPALIEVLAVELIIAGVLTHQEAAQPHEHRMSVAERSRDIQPAPSEGPSAICVL